MAPLLASCAAPTSIDDLTGETSYICDKVIKPGWKGTVAFFAGFSHLGLGFYAIAQSAAVYP